MADINEFINLLESYVKLEKNIEALKMVEGMTQNILRKSQDYHALINLEFELKKYVLDGAEIIGIYKSLKNVYDREKNISDNRHNSIEEEYKSKINELEEAVSNLRESKDNLRKLTKDPNNFFNGEIVKEIKKY